MRVDDFIKDGPSKTRHPVYESSMLYTAAAEWSTGEVLLASAYRGLLLGVGESDVDLENIMRARDMMPASVGGPELWSQLLVERGGIASPLRHGQVQSSRITSIDAARSVHRQDSRRAWQASAESMESIELAASSNRGRSWPEQRARPDPAIGSCIGDCLRGGYFCTLCRGLPPARAASPETQSRGAAAILHHAARRNEVSSFPR